MPQFRKKPVVVEAVFYPGTQDMSPAKVQEMLEFFNQKPYPQWRQDEDGIAFITLEGEMKAQFGDWIIRGVNGEFYPCKPDIFAKTYEAV